MHRRVLGGTVSRVNVNVLHLLADQAAARADRFASSLPLLTRMAAGALAAEMQLRASDHDKLLAAAGCSRVSVLHGLARRTPAVVESATDALLRVARFNASFLSALADLAAPRSS